MTYPAYEKYKESGVPWLGKVPEGWDVKRLRFYIETNPTKSELILPLDTLVSFVPMEAIGENGELQLESTKAISEVSAGYTYFKENDVVIAKITPCFENGKGAIAKDLKEGIAFGTTELHVLRAEKEVLPKFLYLLTTSRVFRKIGESEMYGAGGQKRVPENFIKNFYIALPPLPEQLAIAAFLDAKTAEIDALIAKKEALLALLAERRTALITHAVTKGLNPDAPTKDSDIDWLGHIPAHWEVKRLRFLLSEPLKYGANESAEFEDRSAPRYIRITDVDEDGSLRDETFKSLPEDVAAPYILDD